MEDINDIFPGARPDLINLKTNAESAPSIKPFDINVGSSKVFNPDQNASGNKDTGGIFGGVDKLAKTNNKIGSVALGEYSNEERYSRGTRPGDNWEEQYAQNQSNYEKAFNGVTKGLNLAATTVAGSFGMLYGVGSAVANGDITKVWDNEITQELQKYNEYVDREVLPNFYTQKETDANWYNTDNWMTANFLFDKVIKNAGFAVGAMLSGNIAAGAFKGVGAAIGEAALLRSGFAAAAESASASGVNMANTFKNYNPLLTNIARAFSQGKNIEVATALEANAIKSISDITKLDLALDVITSQAGKYTNIGNKGSRSIVALYSSSGEASMESLMGGNELKRKLIADYIQENGEDPTGANLDSINEKVRSFGKVSFFGNLALLGATEYAQLPYLAGSSWRNSSLAATRMTRDITQEAGKYVEKVATTKIGRLSSNIKKYGQYVFDPKEGGQEMGQYALEVGASNYFEKANKNNAGESWMSSVLDSVGYGLTGVDESGKAVGALNSKEGIEGGLIGALTGGLMMAPGRYKNNKQVNNNTKDLIEQANNAPEFAEVLRDRINVVNRGVELQQQQEEQVKAGDLLGSKNTKTDLMFNYTMHKVKYGRKDLVLSDISFMKNKAQTEEGFKELVDEGIGNINDTREDFNSRLDELTEFTNNLEQTYERLNTFYANQTITAEDGKLQRKYTDDAIERLSYVSTKLSDYGKRITELKGQIAEKSLSTDDLIARIYSQEKIENIDNEINSLIDSSTAQTDTDKSELKEKAFDTIELAILQKEALKEYNQIVAKPENYRANVTPLSTDVDDESIIKEKFTITTESGVKEFEIGTEYALGKVTRFTAKGEEVNSQPRFKVLKENEDGTLKIQDGKGIRDISKKEFENYSVVPSEQMKTNKTYAFLEKVQNVVFEHYGIKRKDGKAQQGRLEYSKEENSLVFAYVNEAGEVKRTIIDRKFFDAQKGFDKPIIRQFSILKAEETQAIDDFANEEEVLTKEQREVSIAKKLAKRNEIISELYESSSKRLEAVNTRLENAQKSFTTQKEALEKQLEKESVTKQGQVRKRQTANMLKLISSLSTLENSIGNEILALESEKEDIENSLPFLKQFQEELESLPENSRTMVNALKNDIVLLETLASSTTTSIKNNTDLLNKIQDLLNSALKQYNKYLGKIKNANPTIPLGIEDVQEYIDNYLQEDGTPLNNAQRKELLAKMQELELDLSMFEDQLSIPEISSDIKTIVDKIDALNTTLKNAVSEKSAKLKILNEFEKIISDENAKKLEAKRIEANQKLAKELVGTLNTDVQIVSEELNKDNSTYEVEPKKSNEDVITGTIPRNDEKVLTINSNQFLNDFHKLDTAITKNLRLVTVTAQTEDQLGVVGLSKEVIRNLSGAKSKAEVSEVISQVVVELDEDGNTYLVNKLGERLTEEDLASPLDHIITQVHPLNELMQMYNNTYGTMFRASTTEDQRKELTKQYVSWRAATLKNDKIGRPQEFYPSFGILEFSKTTNEAGKTTIDYNARNSVESTDLVTKFSLKNETLLAIAVDEETSVPGQTTKLKTKIGSILLNIAGGLVRLNNRKLNNKETDVVYNSLLQLSKIASTTDSVKGNLQFMRIANYIKTIVYWGIPVTQDGQAKSAGYNNIWFQKVLNEEGELVNRLFISGKGFNISFTPSVIEDNKDLILMALSEMYHNVDRNAIKETQTSNQYEQITGYSEDGSPVVTTWQNYQTYLLSEEGRSNEELPLTTYVIPKAEASNQLVRAGMYFKIPGSADNFNFNFKKEEANKASLPSSPTVESLRAEEQVKKAEIEERRNADLENLKAKRQFDITNTAPIKAKYDAEQAQLRKEYDVLISSLSKTEKIEDKSKESTIVEINAESFLTDLITDEVTIHAFKFNVGNFYFTIDKSLTVTEAQSTLYSSTNEKTLKEKASDPGVVAFAESKEMDPMFITIKTYVKGVQDAVDKLKENVKATTEQPSVQETPSQEVTSDTAADRRKRKNNKPDREAYRLVNKALQDNSIVENFAKVEQWVKKVLPNIPVYRVKNIIQATNGKQAWGMLHKGAIYLYENAEQGTVYHEVFEAVWGMTTTNIEKKAVVRDFKNRKGSYIDRFTGKEIKYSEATIDELREELAEEFRDFIMYNKYPNVEAKVSSNLITKIFKEILDTLKAFFIGRDALLNTNELFDRIGNGYYKEHLPFTQKLSLASAGILDIDSITPDNNSSYRRVKLENITATEQHQIMQAMTHKMQLDIIGEGKDMFNIVIPKNSEAIYKKLKDYMLDNESDEVPGVVGGLLDNIEDLLEDSPTDENLIKKLNNAKSLYNNIDAQWDKIVNKHREYLKSYNITFDEATEIDFENNEKAKDEGYGDARQVDAFKNIEGGLKFFLSNIQEVRVSNGKEYNKPNEIGGVTLLPLGEVYASLMEQLHTVTSIDEMVRKLQTIAEKDPNYRTMYRRLFKTPYSEAISFDKMQMHDIRLLQAFYKTFVKEKPDVKMAFMLENGEVEIGDSNTSNAVNELKTMFVSSIANTIFEKKNPYIVQNSLGMFVGTNSLANQKEISVTNTEGLYDLLQAIGIDFTKENIQSSKNISAIVKDANYIINRFKDRFINKNSKDEELSIDRITSTTLDIDGILTRLAIIKTELESKSSSLTHFGVSGQKHQTYIGTNWMSHFHSVISKVTNKKQLVDTTFGYLLTDTFSQGSVLMNSLFDANSGRKINNFEWFLKPVIVDGTRNNITNDNKETAQLSLKDRTTQELNMNINGIYYNLVPGDGAIQSAMKFHDKTNPFVSLQTLANESYLDIFEEYIIAELETARDGVNRKLDKLKGGKKATDLRFFKGILTEDTYNELIRLNADTSLDTKDIYKNNKTAIDADINKYFNIKANNKFINLRKYNTISKEKGSENFNVMGISGFENGLEYSKNTIGQTLKQLAINFAIANIEYHKILYSDPYQYTGQLKRIKSFSSPRQIIPNGSSKLNRRIQELYNDGQEKMKALEPTFNRETIKGATVSDVFSDSVGLGYDPYEETDGGGVITDIAARFLAIKNGVWTSENELQFQYDMAYMKMEESKNKTNEEIKTLGLELTDIQKALYKKGDPKIQSNSTPIKPIVAGNKNAGKDFNDIVLDKFSLFPISYKMLHQVNPNANMLTTYKNMIDPVTGTDYFVYASGRKIGSEKAYDLYDKEGNVNTAPFRTPEEIADKNEAQTVLEIPFSIFGIQSEVPTKEISKVTQGSQPTKLVTMDYMNGGMPIDFMQYETDFNTKFTAWLALNDKTEYSTTDKKTKTKDNLYNEILLNKTLLEERIDNGLETLFNQFGFVKNEAENKYTLSDPSLTIGILKKGLANRELNDNILEALDGYEEGELVLEAIPSYQQIRNMLYSMAHKAVVSSKLTGGQRVQIASTGFESGVRTAKQVGDKIVYESNDLQFYKNGKGVQVCEIMISRWFDSNKTDQELLDYFNDESNAEAQKILRGVAYRIPTQKQNSIEVFKIKKFLPVGYRDSVIVPSALVKKVGSDFDIDKLFIYLKNVYTDVNGFPKQVADYGVGKEAKDKIKSEYKKGLLNDYIAYKQKSKGILQDEKLNNLMDSMSLEAFEDSELSILNSIYRESLDNQYVESFERLVSHPLNFVNLVKPNSAEQLIKLEDDIRLLKNREKINYDSVDNMLDQEFMTGLRHDLTQGKYNIGIGATSQTGNAQAQKTNLFIEESKLQNIPQRDKTFLFETTIRFENYNQINNKPTLSKITDANPVPEDVNYISDVIGQIIDGCVDVNKDPWIMRLGVTKSTAGTWLLLIRMGVPVQDVAFFMNQPIIEDFLQNLENRGITSLFSESDEVKSRYTKTNNKFKIDSFETIENANKLKTTIGKEASELSDEQLAEQLFIFREFQKYAKMAEHLLKMTQATNFDTSTFNDPFLVFKKFMQIKAARETIFSDVDDLLNATFMRKLADATLEFRDAFSAILTSDSNVNPNGISVRDVLEEILTPHILKGDSDFIGTAKKSVMSLFDWAVQTDTTINKSIKRVMLKDENGVSTATKFMKLKEEAKKNVNHPLHNNYVLKQMEMEAATKEGEVDNLFITNKDNKVYDQNQIIFAFEEIKIYLGTVENNIKLYQDLVRLSVLQSGLQNSKYSFVNLIPFSDFIIGYNNTLAKIDKMPNLQDYLSTKMFQRTNWNDATIVPTIKETFRDVNGEPTSNNKNIKKLYKDKIISKEIPQLIKVPVFSQSAADVITFSYTDKNFSAKQRKEMAKKKNFSFIKKGLFQKVYQMNYETGISEPLIDQSFSNNIMYEAFIYKQINALGDSQYVKEYYTPLELGKSTVQQSIINNGYDKVVEVEDEVITSIIGNVKASAKKEKITESNTVTSSQTEQVESFVKVSIPKRESKKSKFIAPNSNVLIEGYKLILPDFEKAEVYISNEFVIDGVATKTKSWDIIVKILDSEKFTFFPIRNSSTIVDILKEFADSINNKYSLTEKNRNLLASIGITLKNNLPLQNTEDTSWKEEDNNDTCVPF